VRALCTAAALAAALSAAALTASSRTAYASRRGVLLSSERRLSNEGELTPWEGELTETDGRLLRGPACTSRLAGLHPEPLGRLLRGGGVLQDVREALVGASSLRGRACRGTGGLSVPRLVCPASNLLMRSAMDGDTALAGKKRRAASVGSADASPRSEVRRRGTWKTAVVPEPSASRPGCVCVWVCC